VSFIPNINILGLIQSSLSQFRASLGNVLTSSATSFSPTNLLNTAKGIGLNQLSNATGINPSLVSNLQNTISNIPGNVTNLTNNITNIPGNITGNITNNINGLTSNITNIPGNISSGVTNSFTNIGGNLTNTVGNISSNITNLPGSISSGVTGSVSNITNSVTNIPSSVSNLLNNTSSQIPTSSFIKASIDTNVQSTLANVKNTLSVPTEVKELKNIQLLNSKNLTLPGNLPLPSKIKDLKIAEGVEANTPGMAKCIKNKIKDLIGVFTVQFGVPSLDQFGFPDFGNVGKISIKEAFRATFNDIKNTVKGTLAGIKEALNFKKFASIDQVETGGLTLGKLFGCETVSVDFTPRERRDFSLNPESVIDLEEKSILKSQIALTDQANENVIKRTQPPIDRSKQELVRAITPAKNVEDQIKMPYKGYYIIFIDSGDLEGSNYTETYNNLYDDLLLRKPKLKFISYNGESNLKATIDKAIYEGEIATPDQSNSDLNELIKDKSGILLLFEFSSNGIGNNFETELPAMDFESLLRIYDVNIVRDNVLKRLVERVNSKLLIDENSSSAESEIEVIEKVIGYIFNDTLKDSIISEGRRLDNYNEEILR